MGGGIIFFSLAGPVGDYTGAHTVFFSQDFFLYIILQKEERSSGRALYFLGCLQGCDGWGEGWGILQIKASVVHWKDIRPWQPEFGPEEKHFVSGNFAGFSLYISSERSAKLRWVGREAHLGR